MSFLYKYLFRHKLSMFRKSHAKNCMAFRKASNDICMYAPLFVDFRIRSFEKVVDRALLLRLLSSQVDR
ncbi:hypothetical protein SAMD00023520_01563 [Listeria monocytogenes]|nr:hypothetical protein SAMD00023520_01563 [Listeria monocytogenes]